MGNVALRNVRAGELARSVRYINGHTSLVLSDQPITDERCFRIPAATGMLDKFGVDVPLSERQEIIQSDFHHFEKITERAAGKPNWPVWTTPLNLTRMTGSTKKMNVREKVCECLVV